MIDIHHSNDIIVILKCKEILERLEVNTVLNNKDN